MENITNINNINEMMRNPLVNQSHKIGNTASVSVPEDSSFFGNPFILGICYVPMQEWEQVYDEDTAFSAGTLFPGLNKPFLGGGR